MESFAKFWEAAMPPFRGDYFAALDWLEENPGREAEFLSWVREWVWLVSEMMDRIVGRRRRESIDQPQGGDDQDWHSLEAAS